MDYTELARELLQKLFLLQKSKPQTKITESLRGESFVLHFIAFNDCHVLPSEISNVMDVSSARVAAALNSLENKGFITRQIDPGDRRRILVSLTPEGKKISEEHDQIAAGDIIRLLSLLGERDAREFVRIIGRLAEIAPMQDAHRAKD